MRHEDDFIDNGIWILLILEKYCMKVCGRAYRYMSGGMIEKGK
jgi:hypothetical protein